MPKARRRRKAGGKGDQAAAEVVYVTAEAKAMVRQALVVDRQLLIHKGKAFDKFMAKFDKIDEHQAMRDFLERPQLPNGYCVRERLSAVGHTQVQVALYNGTGWKDLSVGAMLAVTKFSHKLVRMRQSRQTGEADGCLPNKESSAPGNEEEAAAAAEEEEEKKDEEDDDEDEKGEEMEEVGEEAAQNGLSSDAVEQQRLEYDAAEQSKDDKLRDEAAAEQAAAIAREARKKKERLRREKQVAADTALEAERLQRLRQQDELRRQKAALLQTSRESAVVEVTVVDSGRMHMYIAKPEYKDYSGPDDVGIAKEYGANRRVEAAAAAEKRRTRARQLTAQRHAQVTAEANVQATKSQQAAEALAAAETAARLQRHEKRRAASEIAARKNAAQRIGRARVAWQREQTWKAAQAAAAIAADQDAEHRQRLRRRVQSVSTHPSARVRRPASAPAGGRPNPPRSQVPADEGGATQFNHPVVRYGSRQIVVTSGQLYGDNTGSATIRTGFRPSTPCPPSARPDGHQRLAATDAAIAGIGTEGSSNTSAWVTPLGKRLAHNRALRDRANEQDERPRPRPASAVIGSVLG
eukprot:COSAG02_NODE_7046_length_3212_cov_2.903951_2_plen_580_part_00